MDFFRQFNGIIRKNECSRKMNEIIAWLESSGGGDGTYQRVNQAS
jgi:hypothetical protein